MIEEAYISCDICHRGHEDGVNHFTIVGNYNVCDECKENIVLKALTSNWSIPIGVIIGMAANKTLGGDNAARA